MSFRDHSTFEEIEEAKLLLAKYAEDYDIEDKLERQFYLNMLAQVQRYRGVSQDALSALFTEAVSLTVPAWEQKPLGELVLSSKELNLILEAEQYREGGARAERYLEVIGYLGKGYRDGRSMAKIYPKAVYFLCRCVMEENCYLYVETGVFCTNDVIRIRREMLGMNRKDLCHGICSEKTLYRLERKITSPQSATAEALFERLGLSGELSRTELVTSSPKARELMTILSDKVNKGCWDEANELREKIRTLIPMEIQSNRQVLMRQEILSRRSQGAFSREEYYQRMKEALELTLSYIIMDVKIYRHL